ncbi:MAG: hypothetical protein LQ352_003761 [Teloschistes flavicans]|nr:MAG: hypothetical protein LQ352_003761 [Teloschistes flavicans]
MYPFDGKETQAIRHAIRETPGYFISIRGHLPNGGFEINLMFWGLQFAAHWIAQSRQPSYERQFTVLWENRFIGTIKYWYSAPPSSLGFPDISSPAALSDDFEWNNTISAEPTSNGIVKFDKFHPVRGPVPLDLSSITMTLLAGFITSAAEGIDTPIFSAKYQTGDSRYRPRIQLVTNFGAKPPEWFKFDVVRMMLVRLVILYFEQLKGKEGQRSGYAFDMLYDGRLAGKGVLGIPPGGAFAIEDGTDSVATS